MHVYVYTYVYSRIGWCTEVDIILTLTCPMTSVKFLQSKYAMLCIYIYRTSSVIFVPTYCTNLVCVRIHNYTFFFFLLFYEHNIFLLKIHNIIREITPLKHVPVRIARVLILVIVLHGFDVCMSVVKD